MTKSPHMLIEGMIIAAHAAGANRSFIYIRGEYQEVADILDAALAEARDAGLLATCSWSSTAAPAPTSAARRPALLDSLEGKRGNPRLKPPFPANQGLYQGPTLINNVETLIDDPAHPADGREEYAKIGVANSTGTKVVSVSGNVAAPGQLRDRARDLLARDHLRPRRRPAGGPRRPLLVPRRIVARRC